MRKPIQESECHLCCVRFERQTTGRSEGHDLRNILCNTSLEKADGHEAGRPIWWSWVGEYATLEL